LLISFISIGLFFFNKRKGTGLIFIFYYLLASVLTDLFFFALIKHLTNNQFITYRIFTLVEYSLVTSFLYINIKSKGFKRIIVILSVLFLTFSIFDLINSGSKTFDSSPTGIACILILSYSIYYLFEKIKTPDSLFLYSTANFWIVVALIIFFSGTFFIYIFSQSNFNNPDFKSTFNIINSSFNILKNLLFSIAFLIKPEKGKQPFPAKF
jgi:hypothetical protein